MKWPRQYASEICALKSPEERRDALALVPAPWRELVEPHVRNAFSTRNIRRPPHDPR